MNPHPDPRKTRLPVKGRGTATRIAHRFEVREREVDDAVVAIALEAGAFKEDDPWAAEVPSPTSVTAETARSILSRNDSPDVPFTWSINPYRGCEHGCIYCYARPTHSYLNLSPGLDFEARLLAKVNAAPLLRRELQRTGHEPSPINIGSATDAYQPVERTWRITREVIEVLHACHHPFTVVTKSSGVERDLDLLAEMAQRRLVYVMVSVTTLDGALARVLEPRAAAPLRRLQTVRRLAAAGVPVGVNVAPIIPFLNEPEIERIVEAAAQAGAQAIHYTVVRLPWEVKPLFEEWLQHHVPERAARVMARIHDMRGGRAYQADFRSRMRGEGVWAQLIAQRVRKAAERHGVPGKAPLLDSSRFDPTLLRATAHAPQGELF
jgi:DNA repair photolyase